MCTWERTMIEQQDKCLYYPFNGKTEARVFTEDEKRNLEKWSCCGVFRFAEGYKTLQSMFFYRREWLKCIVLPESMRFVGKYSCVPYTKEVNHKIIEHKKDDYRYPSEWAVHRGKLGYYVSKTEKTPIAVVVKSSKTIFDANAFGDGEGDDNITIFLDFLFDFSKKSRS